MHDHNFRNKFVSVNRIAASGPISIGPSYWQKPVCGVKVGSLAVRPACKLVPWSLCLIVWSVKITANASTVKCGCTGG